MGVCSAKSRNCGQPEKNNTQPLNKQLEVILSDFTAIVALIDISTKVSSELREKLNKLVMLRSDILLDKSWNKSQSPEFLNKIRIEIEKLKNDTEFDHFFPILSIALFELEDKSCIKFRQESIKSTNRSIIIEQVPKSV